MRGGRVAVVGSPREIVSSTIRSASIDGLERALLQLEGLKVRAAEPLSRHCTFRIGGPAELFVEISSGASLSEAMLLAERFAVPWQILGLGSNVLFPDEGLTGTVAKLGGGLAAIEVDGTRVTVGAAVPLALVARETANEGLRGLEALSGFPSTVGGAVVMNAGCYGTEIKDVLVSATVLEDGQRKELSVDDLQAGYRTTRLQGSNAIVTRASFELVSGDARDALARIEELNRKRRDSLPSGLPNAGSIFKNPPGEAAGRLIEECGLKGADLGGARISERHANVIVNADSATAADVVGLMLQARAAVLETFDIELEPEIVLTGSLRTQWGERTDPESTETSVTQ